MLLVAEAGTGLHLRLIVLMRCCLRPLEEHNLQVLSMQIVLLWSCSNTFVQSSCPRVPTTEAWQLLPAEMLVGPAAGVVEETAALLAERVAVAWVPPVAYQGAAVLA